MTDHITAPVGLRVGVDGLPDCLPSSSGFAAGIDRTLTTTLETHPPRRGPLWRSPSRRAYTRGNAQWQTDPEDAALR